MARLNLKNLFFGLWIISSYTFFSQEEYDTVVIRDLETWHNVQFEYKFNKKLRLGISEHVRLDENSLQLDRFFTELELKYKIGKGFGINGAYRFITEQKKSGLSNEHRWNIDGLYSYELNRLKLSSRIRYQSKIEFPTSENTKDNYLRFKIKLAYNFKDWKLDPYLSNELFRPTNNALGNSWDTYRITIGTKYKINKHHSISAFYGGERELNKSYPKTTYLFGLGYRYTLKAKKND